MGRGSDLSDDFLHFGIPADTGSNPVTDLPEQGFVCSIKQASDGINPAKHQLQLLIIKPGVFIHQDIFKLAEIDDRGLIKSPIFQTQTGNPCQSYHHPG